MRSAHNNTPTSFLISLWPRCILVVRVGSHELAELLRLMEPSIEGSRRGLGGESGGAHDVVVVLGRERRRSRRQ